MLRGVGALTTGGGFVWVAERRGNAIVRIDPRTLRVAPWSRTVAPVSAFCYCGGYLWGTITRADSIARIDPRRAGNPLTSVAGHRPAQLVAAGGHLFVASNTDHTVRMFDPRSGKPVRAPLAVPGNPFAMATGDGAVWVTGIQGTVTRIAYR
jgi:streptogramin lyase